MNPFLFFIKILNSSGTVRVASSNPPGTRPTLNPLLSNFLRFLASTAYTPHNLMNRPTKGRLSMNLLESPTILTMGLFFTFIKAITLADSTPCGWNPKIHF